ncbi:MAG: type III-A CRISPR-associated protein Cas10/Csm1 [Desulfobacterota bacterium]|nr:type III-A CRISPR-associated protein Cas10/Csm1 [Thermodesulfobacteriota bacterium]
MDQITMMIAAAGLLHDIGKFAERASVLNSENKDVLIQEYGYPHGGYTGQIIETFWRESATTPCSGMATEINLYNLASRHHKPRNTYETIISEADCLAASHERGRIDDKGKLDEIEGSSRKSQIPLHSILERIALEVKVNGNNSKSILLTKKDIQSRYRLRSLKFGQEDGDEWQFDDFFPVSYQSYYKEFVATDYKKLWEEFIRELFGNKEQICFVHPLKQYEELFHIIKKYTWCMPESTQAQCLPDVALFDHLKATAALAVCLYKYHAVSNTLTEEAIKNKRVKKYALFCGDLSGIQKFIYNISSKGAYRALKGRSFFVQLASEIIARFYLKKFSLPISNLLYASGGKFYILLPALDNIPKQIQEIDDQINLELFEKFGGSIFLRTGFSLFAGENLSLDNTGKTLCEIWDELTRTIITTERKRYVRLAQKDYQFFFNPYGAGGGIQTCDVCHEEIGESDINMHDDKKRCDVCRQMETLGERLRDANFIVVAQKDKPINQLQLSAEFLGNIVYIESEMPRTLSQDSIVFCLNNNHFLSFLEKTYGAGTIAPLMLGGNHRFSKEFEKIAEESQGIKRIGVLRMDVDNLGAIFSEGLRKYTFNDTSQMFTNIEQHKRFNFHSIGRITTLSFQLSFFFGSVVQNIIEKNGYWKERAVIVYAGGDDLFILGAWDVLPEIALEIRNRFRDFTCNNPAFTLSGGMVIVDGKFPIYKSAEMAGDAEEAGKKLKTKFINGEIREKDAFSFLDVPIHWEEFSEIACWKKNLADMIARDRKNRALINRLSLIASSYQESQKELKKKNLSFEELQARLSAERWRWRMVYSLARFCENKPHLKENIAGLQDFIFSPVKTVRRMGIELLHVLARWTELETRV